MGRSGGIGNNGTQTIVYHGFLQITSTTTCYLRLLHYHIHRKKHQNYFWVELGFQGITLVDKHVQSWSFWAWTSFSSKRSARTHRTTIWHRCCKSGRTRWHQPRRASILSDWSASLFQGRACRAQKSEHFAPLFFGLQCTSWHWVLSTFCCNAFSVQGTTATQPGAQHINQMFLMFLVACNWLQKTSVKQWVQKCKFQNKKRH